MSIRLLFNKSFFIIVKMVWRKKWKKLLIAPFILSLFSCSKNVQITFTAAKYIRGYYDYENKIDYSYFEEFDGDGYQYTLTFESGHVITSEEIGDIRRYLFDNTPYEYTSFDPKNDGYEWIKGYYFDLDLKKGFSFNKPLEENVNVYYALIKCSI